MINDNVLGNRLNEFRNKENPIQNHDNPLFLAVANVFTGFILAFKTVAFGYSTKIIFNTDWSVLEVLCIGVTINFILNYISKLVDNN